MDLSSRAAPFHRAAAETYSLVRRPTKSASVNKLWKTDRGWWADQNSSIKEAPLKFDNTKACMCWMRRVLINGHQILH